jgi:hypothetical protein
LWQVDLPHVAGGTCHKKNNKKRKKNRKKLVAGQPATRGRWDLPHVAVRPATRGSWDLPRVRLAAVAAPWQVRLAGVAGRPATPGRV